MVSPMPGNAETKTKHQVTRIKNLNSCQVETFKTPFDLQHPIPTHTPHYTPRFISPLFEPVQLYQAVNTSHLILTAFKSGDFSEIFTFCPDSRRIRK